MAQSARGAHEEPLVGRRREQANRGVGGELAELVARLGKAWGADSIEARRTVEIQRERFRQERLEAERAAELDRQRADLERQRMDQERIEAELRKSVELERQRMERECAEKARVVDASSYRQCGAGAAEAARKLERSQAAWRDDGARHVEAERDRQEQETAMWRQRGREAPATQVEAGANRTEPWSPPRR